MPRIFDNIALDLLPALRQTLEVADRSDFIVDGDSWFNHPLLLDVLDWFNDEELAFAGAFMPGRTLAEMVQRKRQRL